MNYLLACEGVGAFVEFLPSDSGNYYAAVSNAFQRAAGYGGDRFAFVSFHRQDRQELAEGIPFDWELAGPNGASFELLAMPGTTAEHLEKAKNKIRRERDALRISVRRIDRLIPFAMPSRNP